MSYRAFFRDAVTKEGEWSVDDIVYTAPSGNLLEVGHDLDALAQTSADEWKQLWDSRWSAQSKSPYHSGIWGKKELVLPEIPDEHVVTLGEGCSALAPMGSYGQSLGLDNLFVKQCGHTHTGSFKDLGMTVLVSQVNHLVRSGKHDVLGVACASSGDTSAALAAYAAAAGIPAVVLLPDAKVSPAQLVQPMSNNALTLALDTDFDGCMAVIKELTADKKLYLANSMNSLRIEGQKTVAIEIVQQMGWEVPDWIFISGGNLGNTSALYKGFEEMMALGIVNKVPKIVCCQAEAANPLFQCYQRGWNNFTAIEAQTTQASAIRIGNPVSVSKALAGLQKHDGEVAQASEQQLADACARADQAGFFTCPHTGVTLAAVEQYAAADRFKKDDTVVVISTAHGLKFSDIKTGYHAGSLAGIANPLANKPVRLAAKVEAVYEAVMQHIEKRAEA